MSTFFHKPVQVVVLTIIIGLFGVILYSFFSNDAEEPMVLPDTAQQPDPGVSSDFSKLIYFSAVPNNNFNLYENVFVLDIQTDTAEQLTGLDEALSEVTGWSSLHEVGDTLVFIPTNSDSDTAQTLKLIPYRISTELENTAGTGTPIVQDTGYFADQLTSNPTGTRISWHSFSDDVFDALLASTEDPSVALPASFPTVSSVEEGIAVDPIDDLGNWSISIVDTASGTLEVIEGATHPQWISESALLYLKTDGMYAYDFATNNEQLVYEFFELDSNDVLSVSVQASSITAVVLESDTDVFVFDLRHDQDAGSLAVDANQSFYNIPDDMDVYLEDVMLSDGYLVTAEYNIADDLYNIGLYTLQSDQIKKQGHTSIPFIQPVDLNLLHIGD